MTNDMQCETWCVMRGVGLGSGASGGDLAIPWELGGLHPTLSGWPGRLDEARGQWPRAFA